MEVRKENKEKTMPRYTLDPSHHKVEDSALTVETPTSQMQWAVKCILDLKITLKNRIH